MAVDANDLSGKVSLDVTDFKTGIAQLNREIRVIESGFKATTASMDNWAKDATGLEKRIKALTQEMDAQRKKVSLLANEYNKVASEQGENSRAAQELQVKLNKETETLGKMEKELRDTEKALSEMGDESKDAAKGADQLGKAENVTEKETNQLRGALDRLHETTGRINGGLRNLAGTVLKGVAIGLAAVAAAAIGAGIALGRAITGAAQMADELNVLSAKTGIGVEALQELTYAGKKLDFDVETVAKSLGMMTRKLKDTDKEGSPVAKIFDQLGVSARGANGEFRDTQDIFFDLIGALGNVENETERDSITLQLFGKSALELNPLIEAGADNLRKYSDEAHEVGAVLDEETINSIDEFGDSLEAMKTTFKGLMAKALAPLLPVISKLMTAFREWLSDPKTQAAIKNITENIAEFGEKLGKALDKLLQGDVKGALKEIFPPELVDGIASFATKLNELVTETIIPFVQKHGKTLLGVISKIAVAFAAFSIISTVIGWITGLIATISGLAAAFTAAGGGIAGIVAILGGPVTLIIGAVIGLVALLAAAWKNNWFGIRDTLTNFWNNTAKPIFDTLVAWLKVNIPIAIAALSKFWNTVLLPALQTVWNFIKTNIIPIFQAIFQWLAKVIPPAIQALANFWNNVLLPALNKVWSFIKTYIIPLFQALSQLFMVGLKLALTVIAGIWENVLLPGIKAVWQFINDKVLPILQDLFDWFNTKLGPPIQWLVDNVLKGFTAAWDGIKQAIQWVIDKIIIFTDKLANIKLPDWLTPGSPTPFEMGLRGISTAIDEINAKKLRVGVSGANGKQGTSVTYGGDTVTVIINDQLAANMYLDEQRRKKLKYAEGLM